MTDKEILDAVIAEIKRMMAEEVEAYKAACKDGDEEASGSPMVYTRLQMLLWKIEFMKIGNDGFGKEDTLSQAVEVQNDFYEIPFGAKDSELMGFEYNIPDGYYAIIEGDKVVIKRIVKQSVEEAMVEVEEKSKAFTEAHKGETSEEILAQMRGEEPVSDELEEEVKKLWQEINTGHEYSIIDSYSQFYGICLDIAQWQEQKEYTCYEEAFEDGASWKKEQMIKDAVERTVKVDAGGYPYIDATELYDYDKDEPLSKEGDKVKIIIVKED